MEELTCLESRHRKEKKELQAQVQALKKIAKNDKSKKKEITAEIVRLESNMDNRHKQEADDFLSNSSASCILSEVAEEPAEIATSEQIKSKVSKAQKRRDKKNQQDKERQEEIKIQEKENINGPRNIETLTINAKLKERKLKIFQIPSDGDCLYKAVAHQLTAVRQDPHDVDDLRKNAANYIRQHKDDFLPFMSNPNTCEMMTDTEFNEYCDKIENTKVWGGQLEIRALSNSLKCPISIIQSTGPESIEQGTEFNGSPLIITYHRHMYSLGEHYNSTIPYQPEEAVELS